MVYNILEIRGVSRRSSKLIEPSATFPLLWHFFNLKDVLWIFNVFLEIKFYIIFLIFRL